MDVYPTTEISMQLRDQTHAQVKLLGYSPKTETTFIAAELAARGTVKLTR